MQHINHDEVITLCNEEIEKKSKTPFGRRKTRSFRRIGRGQAVPSWSSIRNYLLVEHEVFRVSLKFLSVNILNSCVE